MYLHLLPFLIIVGVFAAIFRIPFLGFPMDEDFAFHTYRAAFASRGIKWQRDVFAFFPQWKMLIQDAIYGTDPRFGIVRIRLLLMAAHSATSMAVAMLVFELTSNPDSSLVAGLLYAYFATSPSLYTNSFNNEQLYLPLLLIAVLLLLDSPENIPYAGMFLAAMCIMKLTAGIFVLPLLLSTLYYYGDIYAYSLALWTGIPIIISFYLDYQLGYLGKEGKTGVAVRIAVAAPMANLKKKYGSIRADFFDVFTSTLPLWLAGIPSLALSYQNDNWLWYISLTVTAIVAQVLQKFFSRYHYLPLIAILAVASGMSLDFLRTHDSLFSDAAFAVIFGTALIIFLIKFPYYRHPRAMKTLSKYRKFDQFIYLPKLGKAIKRLVRMRNERGRIFVWGNFTQLYYYTGLPATDALIHYATGPWDLGIKATYFDSVIGGISKYRPLYIIKTFPNLDMELLQELTGLRYELIKTAYCRFPIYRFHSVIHERSPLAFYWKTKLELMEKLTKGEMVPGIDKTDLHLGEIRRAIKEGKKLCRINKYDVDGLFYLSTLLDLAGRHSEAVHYLDDLLKVKSSFRGARLLLAKQKILSKETDTAGKLIDEEEQLFGNSMELAYYRGTLARAMGALNEAENFFNNALTMQDGDDALKTRLVLDLLQLKNRKENEILKRLLAFLNENPGNENLKYAVASKQETFGKKDEAYQFFDELARHGKQNEIVGAAWFRLARLSPANKREPMLRLCLKILPGHAAAAQMLKEISLNNDHD
ncbi:MAG: tetratricopeptide repeat protein [Nitrospinota bacterium]|nr:tetratricopeptide repeat protein [Nitrospinota bacterium]